VVAVSVAACDAQPTQPAPSPIALPTSIASSVERTVESYVSSFDDVFTQFICEDGTTSELVALEGQLFTRNTVTLNPAGTYHITSHSMPIGLRGVGVETGQEYRVKEQEHMSVRQAEIGYSGTLRDVFVLIGRQSKETYKLVTISHYVVTPQGKVVIERQKERWECGK
jgi:hypothetical protein